MELSTVLSRLGGIARTRDLTRNGVPPRVVQDAVRTGGALRPRRGWITLPDLDDDLMRAITDGVVLSCVTRAARLGLWVTTRPDRLHVAARRNAPLAVDPDRCIHWSAPLVPRRPDQFEDRIENTLALVAECLPAEEALATWESAWRAGFISPKAMRRFPLRPRAREICDAMQPGSDSGDETVVVARLLWLDVPVRQQVLILGHRVDVVIGERLIVQVDGGHHVDRQRASDNAHDALLRLHGYTVIRATSAQVRHDWATIESRILEAIGQRLHLAP